MINARIIECNGNGSESVPGHLQTSNQATIIASLGAHEWPLPTSWLHQLWGCPIHLWGILSELITDDHSPDTSPADRAVNAACSSQCNGLQVANSDLYHSHLRALGLWGVGIHLLLQLHLQRKEVWIRLCSNAERCHTVGTCEGQSITVIFIHSYSHPSCLVDGITESSKTPANTEGLQEVGGRG